MSWRISNKIKEDYLSIVKNAITNDAVFNKFKRLDDYALVIGMPAPVQSAKFIHEAMKDEEIKANIYTFSKMDSIGSPKLISYLQHSISINLTRYLDSIRLLKKHFGSLDGFTLKELGVGYSGLLHCIHTQWTPKAYHIIDLPEVMELAMKHSKVLGWTPLTILIDNVDLAIAEFSITELSEEELYLYTDNHLMKAKNIFIRANHVDKDIENNWIKELKRKFIITQERELWDSVRINSVIIGKS